METNFEQWKLICCLETKTKTRIETNSEKPKLAHWNDHRNHESKPEKVRKLFFIAILV